MEVFYKKKLHRTSKLTGDAVGLFSVIVVVPFLVLPDPPDPEEEDELREASRRFSANAATFTPLWKKANIKAKIASP